MGPNVPLPANRYSKAQRLTSTKRPTAPPHLKKADQLKESGESRLWNLLHPMYVAFSQLSFCATICSQAQELAAKQA